MKLLKTMKRVEKRLLKSFLKKMKVKFVVCVQCLNIRGFYANTLSQCCHVTMCNYCLKSISYEDRGKMCEDSIVKSTSVMMHRIRALNISDIKMSALLFIMLTR